MKKNSNKFCIVLKKKNIFKCSFDFHLQSMIILFYNIIAKTISQDWMLKNDMKMHFHKYWFV